MNEYMLVTLLYDVSMNDS